MKKIRIKAKRPYVAYPGSLTQQNYAEELRHGYLFWDIKDKDSFDVRFCELPNPCPFVTIDWVGSVTAVVSEAKKFPFGSRFRIRHTDYLSHKDTSEIVHLLKNDLRASEVTFKNERLGIDNSVIKSGSSTLFREDLLNNDVLMRLLKEHCENNGIDCSDWDAVEELVKSYVARLNQVDFGVRNVRWSLKHLKFDNTFGYGDGNVINFSALEGIIGVFGPNRAGKSSIPGTIMYSLFNDTDRGSIKNIDICNVRKQYCLSRAILNVDGNDYVVERQTTKFENKRGETGANTALNLFVMKDGEALDLCGEQRTDTEKTIRNLVGSADDLMLTSLSVQGNINQYISLGAAKRRQALSRFLNLDVFDRLFDFAKTDLNAAKIVLKQTPTREWGVLVAEKQKQLDEHVVEIKALSDQQVLSQARLEKLNVELASVAASSKVSHKDIEKQRNLCADLRMNVGKLTQAVDELRDECDAAQHEIDDIASKLARCDIDQVKSQLEAYRSIASSVTSLQHVFERENTLLEHHEKSKQKLMEVPCGDKFPSCKFIKDAHTSNEQHGAQRERVKGAQRDLDEAKSSLERFDAKKLTTYVERYEEQQKKRSSLVLELSTKQTKKVKADAELTRTSDVLVVANNKLDELEKQFSESSSARATELTEQITQEQSSLKRFDNEKMQRATSSGRIRSEIDALMEEERNRHESLQKIKRFELITDAFSRKGIPSTIVSSQLPVINAEISSILAGIVDFTVELENDVNSDQLEVYINYGDSRRIIELGSGMEKAISSIAIRTALSNVSTLPKSDMLIIDEGLDALDAVELEACGRLLVSLKKHFRLILVITHLPAMQDIADTVLEINKHGKDAKVVFT